MRKPDRYFIEAAARTLDVLALFDSREELRLVDVATELGLIKSSAFRFLYTLEQKGYIERTADGRRYRRRCSRRVGLVSISGCIPFVAEVERGIDAEARKAGMNLLVRHHEFQPARALAAVAELLDSGVQLLAYYNPDENISHIVADRCALAGIPTVAITFPIPGAKLFGINNYRAGLAGGEGLGDQILHRWNGDVDQVVLLDIPGNSPAQQARMTGMLEGLKKNVRVPESAVLHLHAGRRDGKADELMLEVFRSHAHPRRIAVLCYNDVNALGALAAVERARLRDKVAIVSQGAVAEVRQEIARAGSPLWGAVARFPECFGARLIPLLKHILRGEPAPSTTYTEHMWLTRSNVQRYGPGLILR
jgi:ribose transport system substrate-binding protein